MSKRQELTDQIAAIDIRLAELDLIIAERRVEFHATGIKTPLDERAKTDAEIARLRLERHRLQGRYRQVDREVKAERRNHINTMLRRVLEEEGLGHLIVRAEQMAMQHQGVTP